MPKYRVQVCQFPGNHSTHPAASDYVTALVLQMATDPRIGIENVIPWRKSDTPITMTRNQSLVSAQENKADYVVMIDSDMEPDLKGQKDDAKPFWASSWEFMLANPMAGMIAAPYCGPGPESFVYVFRWNTNQEQMPNPNARIEMYDRHTAAFKKGIEQVAALPTGLTIINMRAVAEMRKPWFDYEWKDRHGNGERKCQTCGHPMPGERSQKASTEDVYFSRNMQAIGYPDGKTKWPIFCNWDAWAGHHKMQMVGPPQKLDADFFPQCSRRWADAAPPLGITDPYADAPSGKVTMDASDTAPHYFPATMDAEFLKQISGGDRCLSPR
jgi:hypothetical protein